MSHARRYHEPGVGSRTGLRMDAENEDDLSAYYRAGRKALGGRYSKPKSQQRASSSSVAMSIEESTAPSPRTTIRKSFPGGDNSTFAFDKTQGNRIVRNPLTQIQQMTGAFESSIGEEVGVSSPTNRFSRTAKLPPTLEARKLARQQQRKMRMVAVSESGMSSASEEVKSHVGGNSRALWSESSDDEAGSTTASMDLTQTAPITERLSDVEVSQVEQAHSIIDHGDVTITREIEKSPASMPAFEEYEEQDEIEIEKSLFRVEAELARTFSDVSMVDPSDGEDDKSTDVQSAVADKRDERSRSVEQILFPNHNEDQPTASSIIDDEQSGRASISIKGRLVETDDDDDDDDDDDNDEDYVYDDERRESTEIEESAQFTDGASASEEAMDISGIEYIESEHAEASRISRLNMPEVDDAEFDFNEAEETQSISTSDGDEYASKIIEKVRTRAVSAENGLRRGTRYRYKPLEYWRGETVRYGRPSPIKERRPEAGDETIDADEFEDGIRREIPPLAVLKEIIRIPRKKGEGTFSGMMLPHAKISSQGAKNPKRAQSQTPDPTQPTKHPEDGMDADTETHAMVYDKSTNTEVERQIACTSQQIRPRMAEGHTFGFEKVFVVEEFMATGVMFLLKGGKKPMKNSKENYYSFTVMEGCVEVTIHETTFLIAPCGMFFVPKWNNYSIKNASERVARLSFTQTKSPSPRTTPRSSSTAAA